MNDRHAGGGRLDFSAIRAANPIADTIARYLELKKQGGEYKARCPFHADRNPSFAIVPRKEKAFCNACGWHGDVIDFIAEFESVETAEAARRLSGGELPNERPKLPDLPPDEADDWTPVLPVPSDQAYSPAKTYNPRRARFVDWSRIVKRQDAYRDATGALLGYVMRLEIDGDKLTPTVVYAEHRDGRKAWISGRFPSPRPLQGLDDLASRPNDPVLVVEGEKCRAVAAELLPGFVVVTWPGGTNAVDKADWAPLRGRNATWWPDADEAGTKAAVEGARLARPRTARMLTVDGLAAEFGKGADIADLVAAGWDRDRVIAWARQHVKEFTPETTTPPKGGASDKPAGASGQNGRGSRTAQAGEGEGSDPTQPAMAQHGTSDAPSATAPDRKKANGHKPVNGAVVDLPNPSGAYSTITNWASLGLELSDKGVPHPNLDNAAALLERHPAMQGHFWYDEFLQRILSTWNLEREPREWTDSDDARLALWMQRVMKIGRMAVGTARDAVTVVAMAHRRNECREWLESLTWDGTPRLETLIPKAFGAEDNAYTQAVGRCWLVSMVARVLNPGCKVDTMPVFEGKQGRGKSTALQVLVGSRWFAEASESPTSKDFFQALNGKLLVEIGEMDSFSRAEVHTIKRVLSCQSDRYRAPYGRRAEDHPRMGVLAGTTNKDDWNRDETGARRLWPIACTDIDLGWIRAQREQLFAEAVARHQAGESWWDVPTGDAEREQEARRSSDEWERIVGTWLATCGKFEVTVGDVLAGALKLEADKWDKAVQMRCATVLRVLGWKRDTVWRGGKAVKIWTPETGGKGGNELFL